jgi:hypothetical protein
MRRRRSAGGVPTFVARPGAERITMDMEESEGTAEVGIRRYGQGSLDDIITQRSVPTGV